MAVAETADSFESNRAGWGRITPFAIPIVPIRVLGDQSADLMWVIDNALSAAGYTTTEQPGVPGAGGAPVMEAWVTRYRFNNYTWFVPIVPTWGGIGVTLTLRGEHGVVLWRQSFSGRAMTFNFFDGYNIASRRAVTRMGQDMVRAFNSLEFQHLVRDANNAGAADTVSEQRQN